jgi:hypothetical protein
MREWTEFFRKSVIEGFGSFIWSANKSIFYPYTYTPKSLSEDSLNLLSDYESVILKLKENKNDKR